VLKVGLVLPTREEVMAGSSDPRALIAAARLAEDAGFDSTWIGDSLFHRPRFDPLTMLAAVAATTTRIAVGTAVLIPALRQPVLLAHQLATIDRIAGGRLTVGVGAGWVKPEFDLLGVPFGERLGRMVETVRLCRKLWDGDGTELSSKYWSFDPVELLPRPVGDLGSRFWYGGMGPAALRNAGKTSNGWMPTPVSPEAFAEGWSHVRRAAEDAGRHSSGIVKAAYLTVNVDTDIDRARDETERYVRDYYGIPYESMKQVQSYHCGMDGCVEWLQRFEQAGAEHLVIRFSTTDLLPQVERFATDVLPPLKRA
jgi:probable F420-dependent oxidoreductase